MHFDVIASTERFLSVYFLFYEYKHEHIRRESSLRPNQFERPSEKKKISVLDPRPLPTHYIRSERVTSIFLFIFSETRLKTIVLFFFFRPKRILKIV